MRHYLCLTSLLQLGQAHGLDALENYAGALAWQYGEHTLDEALATVLGERRFHGLEAVDSENLTDLPAMQHLLAAYGKLQKAKTT